MPRSSGPVSVTCMAMISPHARVHYNFDPPPRCRAKKTVLVKSGRSLLSPLRVSVLCTHPFPCAAPLPVRLSKGALAPRRCRTPAALQMKNGETVPAYPPENETIRG